MARVNAKKEAQAINLRPHVHRADRLGLNNKIKGDQDIGPWSNTDYLALRWYP